MLKASTQRTRRLELELVLVTVEVILEPIRGDDMVDHLSYKMECNTK